MIAGVHTQPAALTVALERQGGRTPNVGYAAAFPFATIFKIVLAQ
jgi:putative transport protein